MTKHTIILNPTSGRGNGAKVEPAIRQRLQELGLAFELVLTQYPGHAVELAEQASASSQVVVSAGGDGTLNETLNGLMAAKQAGKGVSALGLLPVGRGNDFGYGAGIPFGLETALQTLAAGKRKVIDVGFVQGGDYPAGRYFGNGVGIGFDAVVGFEALKLKFLTGLPSYLVAALKTIFLYYQAPKVRLEYPTGETQELSTLMVSIMNGRRMGGGFHMAPESHMDDGQFDVCIAGQVSRPGILTMIPRFMKGTQGGHPAIQFVRTPCITVTAVQGTLPAHADGETLCHAGQRLELRIIPQALEMVAA